MNLFPILAPVFLILFIVEKIKLQSSLLEKTKAITKAGEKGYR